MAATKPLDENWQKCVPDVYKWADAVQLSALESGAPNAGTIVLGVRAKTDDKSETKREILTGSVSLGNLATVLLSAWKLSGWQGKSGSLVIPIDQERKAILVPLSSINTTTIQLGRQFGLDVAKALKEYPSADVQIFVDTGSFPAAAVIDGLGMGFYDIGLFKGQRSSQAYESMPKKCTLVGAKQSEAQLKAAKSMIKATALTRMLQDAPANWLTPEKFAQIAKDVSKELGLKCQVLGRKELADAGAGSYLSVAAGSVSEPQMIVIEIPGAHSTETVALVGKGLTFDSGGISLKPGLGMGEMKYDMSGGAAVLGAAYYLGHERPRTKVVCVIGAVENMPGPTATRPGDVVVAMNGKTIDIQNTDAEGRLVLCDLLHYTNIHFKPTLMVDIATLTGAVLHALGHAGAALMSNDQHTADQVLKVAREQGEPFWQLPLWPELEKEVKGECSDLQNIAKPNVQAGTIIGGMFLAEFVGNTKWVHLDIAGTGWGCKATGFPVVGGSAFGLRTMTALCS